MKTEALIAMLACGPVAADSRTTERRIATAVATGLLLAFAAMWLFLGPRRDLADAASLPMFWLKPLVPTLLAAAFAAASLRLATPGGRAGGGWLAAGVVVALLWLMAGADLARLPPMQRAPAIEGSSAWPCVASIAALSLPSMAALFVALKSLAPTHPARAGLSAGALSGSLAAAVYALHCNETTLPFLAVWYVLGIAVPAMLGAALGWLSLRWS